MLQFKVRKKTATEATAETKGCMYLSVDDTTAFPLLVNHQINNDLEF